MQSIVKTLAHKKGLTLAIEVAPDVPALFADEAKFKQIMYNLFSNAIKFTPEGGKVSVTAALQSEAELDAGVGRVTPCAPSVAGRGLPALPGECVRITVADTGIGIQPRNQERIFAEFEQEDSSYGRQQQGTGLGLSLTRRLVELHGGRIWVESEGIEGRGSVFTFLMPLPKVGRVTPCAPSAAGRGLPALPSAARWPDAQDEALRPLVSVVTEDAASEKWVGDYLTGVGYGVAVIPAVEAMPESLKARRPYAVLMDGKMAACAGGQELRRCRTLVPARIPLVVFSINGDRKPTFNLFGTEGSAAARKNSRLIDAIRQSVTTSGKEVKTVLVIDDEPAILELLSKTLLQKGFRVLRASQGRMGVEFATQHLPDVIILDLTMPDFNGVQVVEQLRAQPRTKDIPILINTGTALNEDERQRLAGHVQSITGKTEQASLLAELDHLEALREDMVETGVNS